MWADVDIEELRKEQLIPSEPCTKQEIEKIVGSVRLELYNRAVPCGPQAIRKTMDEIYHLRPLPSTRTIARILKRNGLTNARTGWYEGDGPEKIVPASTSRCSEQSSAGV
jgi:hypothetical protein